jgi:hypothetical protein
MNLSRACVVVLIAAALAAPVACAALDNEPDGFGKAKFGMTVKTVREAFPAMRPLGQAPDSALEIFTVDNQSFAGLQPCNVTFSFLADKLYETKLDCGRGPNVKETLYKTFGTPSDEEDNMTIWRGERTIVSMNTDVSTFAFASTAYREMLNQYILHKALTAGPPGAEPPHEPAQDGTKEKAGPNP